MIAEWTMQGNTGEIDTMAYFDVVLGEARRAMRDLIGAAQTDEEKQQAWLLFDEFGGELHELDEPKPQYGMALETATLLRAEA